MQVGEAVEVDQDGFGEWLFLPKGNRNAFGPAADGAGEMERGGGMGAAGEDEIRERRELGVRCIDSGFKCFCVVRCDAWNGIGPVARAAWLRLRP